MRSASLALNVWKGQKRKSVSPPDSVQQDSGEGIKLASELHLKTTDEVNWQSHDGGASRHVSHKLNRSVHVTIVQDLCFDSP